MQLVALSVWTPSIRNKLSPGQYLDTVAEQNIEKAPECIVTWILMASFLYYHRDFSIFTDTYYDELCRRLLETYGTVRHRHKLLITTDDLKAGSLFNLAEEEYPTIVKDCARVRVEYHWGIHLD